MKKNNYPFSLLSGDREYCLLRSHQRTATYPEPADNGIGNGNHRNSNRNNTAYNGGRADKGRKRTFPDRERRPGNRADFDPTRTESNGNGKAKGRNQAYRNDKNDRAIDD